MKKLVFLFCLSLSLSPFVIQAQRVTGCGFKVPPRSLRSNFASVYEAKEIINNMLNIISWQENFSVREQNGIQNAYATIINRVRWIVYDNNFLEDLDAYTSTKWASISVLAHEIGHHYYNHVVSSSGSVPPKEIEADAFSGYVLAKMGATLQQSIAAMQAIASDRASSSHPAKNDRVAAITRGWNEAQNTGNASNSGNNRPTTNPGNTTPSIPQPTPPANPSAPGGMQTDPNSDPSWIWLTVQSNKDEAVSLSDDGKNFQQVQVKAGQPFVFKFEIYNYGWLRLRYFNGYRTYKLSHGKDYSILWNRRAGNWVLVEIGN
ncbi:MAG: hypothetical protein KIT80_01745 [Chitinophagaceae bacterium]|nr:hypothetical protein [Chitinophagaceae bacterium]MCW5925608.1 hypothetical protein [Chitinophagaceae bacterium]